MEWMSIDLIAKVLLPITTFALGIFVTLLSKRRERRTDNERVHIGELITVLNEWYGKVHELFTILKYQPEDKETKLAACYYVGSRIYLPKVVFRVESLRERPSYAPLIEEVEAFISIITRPMGESDDPSFYWMINPHGQMTDLPDYGLTKISTRYCNDIFTRLRDGAVGGHDEKLNSIILRLDHHLQVINALAGRALP